MEVKLYKYLEVSKKRFIKNSFFLFTEHFLRIFSGFFVTLYLSTHLEPERFGLLAFPLTILTLTSAITRFGLESIIPSSVTKDVVNNQFLFSSSFIISLIGSLTIFFLTTVFSYFFSNSDEEFFLITLFSICILFQPFIVVDHFLQGFTQTKYGCLIRLAAITCSLLLKIYLININVPLIYLTLAWILEYAIVSLVLLLFKHRVLNEFRWFSKLNSVDFFKLLKRCLIMSFVGLSGILAVRMDQLFVKFYFSYEVFGNYVLASKFFEVSTVTTFVIANSSLPFLKWIKNDNPKEFVFVIKLLVFLLFWLSIFTIVFVFFCKDVITLLISNDYKDVYSIYLILLIGSPFFAFTTVGIRWCILLEHEDKILKSRILAIIFNAFLNALLIPIFGVYGAAFATVFSIVISGYLYFLIEKELRKFFIFTNRALFLFDFKSQR